jgi:ribosome-associated protein
VSAKTCEPASDVDHRWRFRKLSEKTIMSDEPFLEITSRLRIPFREFSWSVARSSGPGGQNVNKVNSKVILRWSPRDSAGLPSEVLARFLGRYGSRLTEGGELIVASERFRDQPKNRADCLEKLAALLRSVAVPPKVRRATKPSLGSKRRRLVDKKQRSQTKQRRRRPEE